MPNTAFIVFVPYFKDPSECELYPLSRDMEKFDSQVRFVNLTAKPITVKLKQDVADKLEFSVPPGGKSDKVSMDRRKTNGGHECEYTIDRTFRNIHSIGNPLVA